MASAPTAPGQRSVTLDIPWRTLLRVVVVVGSIWLLARLWPIAVTVVVALILVGTITPAVDWLERKGMRRTWAVAAVFLAGAATAALCVLLVVPPLWKQLLKIVSDAPALQERLARMLGHNRLTAPLGAAVQRYQPSKALTGDAMTALAYSAAALEGVGYAVTSVVLSLYLVADRDRARGALFSIVPREYHVRLARILLNLQTIVGGYMRGQLITSLAIGVFAFALLTILRVPGAVALAAFAALTDVIPFVGGLLATTPAVLAALSRGLPSAAIVLVALVVYQEFESRVLVPRIYGRTLRLASAAVVVALLVGGKLLGIVGALLALPIAAGLCMVLEELRVSLPGDDTDDTVVRERDAQAERAYADRSAGAAPGEAAAVASEIADEIREEQKSSGQEPTTEPL